MACGTVLLKPYILQAVFFKSRQKKVNYHMTIMLRIDGDSRSIIVCEEVRSSITHSNQRAHQTVNFSRCNGLSSITWGFSDLRIRQFCFMTYQLSVKCASSLKKILSDKLPSITCCSSTHSTYLGLYMDVGVDLNAK